MMGEITEVHLVSKDPINYSQEKKSLKFIKWKAKDGFKIELQCEVIASNYVFIVWRIIPLNKFYGMVDDDTIFKIVHETHGNINPFKPPEINLSTTNSLVGLTDRDVKEIEEIGRNH